jgi:hypothetical protein
MEPMEPELPENPTDEEIKELATNIIRQTFEDDAVLTSEIESLPGDGWKVTYKARGREFNLEWQGGRFNKWPVGVQMDDEIDTDEE